MSASALRKIFVVGGTGAQGMPVVRGLVKDGKYAARVLTRNKASARAQDLVSLGNVELVEGTFADEDDLRSGLRGCWGAFVNIDGFNCGEKMETFWSIRAYELAIEEGVEFFVFANLDYVYKKSGYDPKFRTGHYDGKGRIAEWILAQAKDNRRMGAAVFTTGPYIQMAFASQTIMTPAVEDGVVTWRVPLADGAVVHVDLDDCEHYVRWLFDHPDRSNGMDLEVGIEHVDYHEMAKAFEKVTGHPARYIDTSFEDYWEKGPLHRIADMPAAYNSGPEAMSFKQNFSGFWTIWRNSANNRGVVRRDYDLLDEIHPGRARTVEEWLQRENETGLRTGLGSLWDRVQEDKLKPALKLSEDGRKGRL